MTMDAEDRAGVDDAALYGDGWPPHLVAVPDWKRRARGPGWHLAGKSESRIRRLLLPEYAVRPDRMAAQPSPADIRNVRSDDHLGTDPGRTDAVEWRLVFRPRKRRNLQC